MAQHPCPAILGVTSDVPVLWFVALSKVTCHSLARFSSYCVFLTMILILSQLGSIFTGKPSNLFLEGLWNRVTAST